MQIGIITKLPQRGKQSNPGTLCTEIRQQQACFSRVASTILPNIQIWSDSNITVALLYLEEP